MPLNLTHLTTEFLTNPLGIDSHSPRLGWVAQDVRRGQRQVFWQVRAASTLPKLTGDLADLWDSGKVASTSSPFVSYAGVPLTSRQQVWWQARAWDTGGEASKWSEPASFEMGLLHPQDWQASWMGYGGGRSGYALYFRREFPLTKPVSRGRVYLAGLGYHELRCNGQKVGQHVLDPGVTDFSKTVLYVTHDITPHLQQGNNVLGIILGCGWFGTPKALLMAYIDFEDGSQMRLRSGSIQDAGTGSSWLVTDGPITNNSIYDGEIYDARLEKPGWDTANTQAVFGPWMMPMNTDGPAGILKSQVMEPIQVMKTLNAKALCEPKPGFYIFDMGQNFAGWAQLSVQGARGTTVTMRYAESLYPDGTINQENLRLAKAADTYILNGEGVEVWEPRFTYHGFRYIQVEGYPGIPELSSVRGRVVYSSVKQTGDFSCSNDLLNRIHRLVQRTETSNLHSIPTDCPQRDERMGWLNDLAARSEGAVYNFGMARFFAKFIGDVADAQDSATGAITDTAPYRWGGRPADPVSVCYLLIPSLLYRHYGDLDTMTRYYQGLKGWVDCLATHTKDHIVDYSYYGDWSPPVVYNRSESAVNSNTPGELISTAMYCYSARMLSKIAGLLGEKGDKIQYRELSQAVFDAFNNRFWDEQAGGYGTNNQSCNAFALYLRLVPPEREVRTITSLAKAVADQDDHLSTGNIGTKYLLEALSQGGRVDLALKVATQETYPSWGYMLANGATTLWERWELATGGGMNSHNHPMMGGLDAWLYRWLTGLQVDPDCQGMERLIICPPLVDSVTWASARLETVRGPVEVRWERQDGALTLACQVPVGSSALVRLPNAADMGVEEGGMPVWGLPGMVLLPGINAVHREGADVLVSIGSGSYTFHIATNITVNY